jgi:hypothetical protein
MGYQLRRIAKELFDVDVPASIGGLILGGTSGAFAVVTTTCLSVGSPAVGTVVVAAVVR